MGCHAKCEWYLAWSAAHEKEREMIRTAKAEENHFQEYVVMQVRRRKK